MQSRKSGTEKWKRRYSKPHRRKHACRALGSNIFPLFLALPHRLVTSVVFGLLILHLWPVGRIPVGEGFGRAARGTAFWLHVRDPARRICVAGGPRCRFGDVYGAKTGSLRGLRPHVGQCWHQHVGPGQEQVLSQTWSRFSLSLDDYIGPTETRPPDSLFPTSLRGCWLLFLHPAPSPHTSRTPGAHAPLTLTHTVRSPTTPAHVRSVHFRTTHAVHVHSAHIPAAHIHIAATHARHSHTLHTQISYAAVTLTLLTGSRVVRACPCQQCSK